ncbi:MAG: HNH endonuclease [Candidatus Binatia bacterium]
MTSYISTALRQLVATRAQRLCEYCLIHEEDAFFGCEVDHIISEKHGGQTESGNLAFACVFCNRARGSDIGSIIQGTNLYRSFLQSSIGYLGGTFRA